MGPGFLANDIDFLPELQGDLQHELPADSYAEFPSDFPNSINPHYELRDRVVINDEGDGDDRNSRYQESEDKWETIPQGLLFEQATQHLQYNADPLDFLTPAEAADLPDLDFPVPDQNIIPEMVFENDEPITTSQGPSPQIEQPQQQYFPQDIKADLSPVPTERTETPVQSKPLIPIQSSVVAHARAGKMSVAAIHERRVKNTEAARRSRARRADKLTELRLQNEKLLAQNSKLLVENKQLTDLVQSLENQLSLKE